MNLQRAEEIITFVKNLSPTEKNFVRNVVNTSTVKRTSNRKRKNGKYSDEQIKQAWELTKKGLKAKEIAKITKIKVKSISKAFLKERLKNIKKKNGK